MILFPGNEECRSERSAITLEAFRLDGKVAAITGAGSGIGRAIAQRFAQEGAAVRVIDLDEKSGGRRRGAGVRHGN